MTPVLSPPSHSDGCGALTGAGPITVLSGTFAGTVSREALASEMKRTVAGSDLALTMEWPP